MRIFLGYAFASSLLYIGITCGYMYGKRATIEKVVSMTCDRIQDRLAHQMCAITVRENLNAIDTKAVSE